ncbi:MAG: polysaccharide deacetylase family protein [Ktedonobacteraceae bacterium]
MRERIRVFLAACFYYSGLVKLVHWKIRRSGKMLIILNYHRAIGNNLVQQLHYLHRHYRILHLETALKELYDVQKGKQKVQDRRVPLVLTFDDGYRDNYTHAFPLARDLQIPFTIFLLPCYIENGGRFWWLEGKHLVKYTQVDEVIIEGCKYSLKRTEDQERLAQLIDTRLRHSRSVAEREAYLKAIRKSLNVSSATTMEDELCAPLTWAEIGKMEESGLVSFGAHTLHHPLLSYLSDPEEVKREVYECKAILEQKLNCPVNTFAYPIGKFEHFGEQGLQAAKEAGYKWALTTTEAINTAESDPYLLNRLPGDIEQHWLVMASELVGLLGIVSRLRKKL